jgi:hypothetical protein
LWVTIPAVAGLNIADLWHSTEAFNGTEIAHQVEEAYGIAD